MLFCQICLSARSDDYEPVAFDSEQAFNDHLVGVHGLRIGRKTHNGYELEAVNGNPYVLTISSLDDYSLQLLLDAALQEKLRRSSPGGRPV